MKMSKFMVSVYDQDEDDMNENLKGAVKVHVVDCPYNLDENDKVKYIFIYAFYPDKKKGKH